MDHREIIKSFAGDQGMAKLLFIVTLCSCSLFALSADSDKEVIKTKIITELTSIRDFAAEKASFYGSEYRAMIAENDVANDFFLEIFRENEIVMKNIFINSEEALKKFSNNEPLWKQKVRLQLLRNKIYAYYADIEDLRNHSILRRNEGMTAKSMQMLSYLGGMIVKVSSVAIAIKSIYDLWPVVDSNTFNQCKHLP